MRPGIPNKYTHKLPGVFFSGLDFSYPSSSFFPVFVFFLIYTFLFYANKQATSFLTRHNASKFINRLDQKKKKEKKNTIWEGLRLSTVGTGHMATLLGHFRELFSLICPVTSHCFITTPTSGVTLFIWIIFIRKYQYLLKTNMHDCLMMICFSYAVNSTYVEYLHTKKRRKKTSLRSQVVIIT